MNYYMSHTASTTLASSVAPSGGKPTHLMSVCALESNTPRCRTPEHLPLRLRRQRCRADSPARHPKDQLR
jgi:hypothetical protein